MRYLALFLMLFSLSAFTLGCAPKDEPPVTPPVTEEDDVVTPAGDVTPDPVVPADPTPEPDPAPPATE